MNKAINTSGMTMGPPESSVVVTDYGRDYYDEYGRLGPSVYARDNPKWLQFFGRIADELVRRLNPRTVLDVGCAKGFLVESLRDRGVEAYGVDISEYAIQEVRSDIRPYCTVGSAINFIKRDYDLITCIEVCEHMREAEVQETLRQLTAHSDTVLFSSTPSNFAEPTHINVHPIIDWLRLFGQFSFAADESFDTSFFAHQAILFRRVGTLPSDQSLCHFAHLKTRAVVEAETPGAGEAVMMRRELEAIYSSTGWKLLAFCRDLRFRVKHPLAQGITKVIGLAQHGKPSRRLP